jgi:hypothetical protein
MLYDVTVTCYGAARLRQWCAACQPVMLCRHRWLLGVELLAGTWLNCLAVGMYSTLTWGVCCWEHTGKRQVHATLMVPMLTGIQITNMTRFWAIKSYVAGRELFQKVLGTPPDECECEGVQNHAGIATLFPKVGLEVARWHD